MAKVSHKISQKGYILHQMAYKNNSIILSVLTETGVLVRGICHGGRKKNLSLFGQYWFCYQQKHELALFTQVEICRARELFNGRNLYCGLYLNELLVKLLKYQEPMNYLFDYYENTLQQLARNEDAEKSLRLFEQFLLKALGYALSFDRDAEGMSISPMCYYSFLPREGLRLSNGGSASKQQRFLGSHLLAVAQSTYDSPEVYLTAKKILRAMLNELLQGKPLVSRQLFQSLQTTKVESQ